MNTRKLFELCQEYRHTPVDQFALVQERYQAICDYVREIRNEALEEAAKAADLCYSGIGPIYSQDIGHMLRCMKQTDARSATSLEDK